MTVIYRIAACLLQFVLCLDEIAQVGIRGPIYIITGRNLPTCHETISAWVGASAALGKPWAVESQKLLDGIFGAAHCERANRHESAVETPAN